MWHCYSYDVMTTAERPILTYDARLREGIARLLLTAARGEQLPSVTELDRELYRAAARYGGLALLVRDESGKQHEFVSERWPFARMLLKLLQEASAPLRQAVS